MTASPLLVLGLGNQLLGDDAVGLEMLSLLASQGEEWGGAVDFLDGGTQGLMLLGHIARRPAVLLLDAVARGDKPGTVHVMRVSDVSELGPRGATAHEGNAGELLGAARLLGELPGVVMVVGIEPARVATGIGLSGPVRRAVGVAVEAARSAIREILAELERQPAGERVRAGLSPRR